MTRASFLNQFALNASFKEQAFPIVVQFIPLHFKPDKAPEIHQVEKDNGLPDGSLLQAHWISWHIRELVIRLVVTSFSSPLLLIMPIKCSLMVWLYVRNVYTPKSARRNPPAA